MKRALREGRLSPLKTETRALIAGTAIGTCVAYAEAKGYNYLRDTMATSYGDEIVPLPPDFPPTVAAAIGGTVFGLMWGKLARSIGGETELEKY